MAFEPTYYEFALQYFNDYDIFTLTGKIREFIPFSGIYIYIYIYIYMCVCVCVCARARAGFNVKQPT